MRSRFLGYRWKDHIMRMMSVSFYNRFFYYYLHFKNGCIPKPLNLRRPKSFNEKTIWLKTNKRYTDAIAFTDKVLAKDYVKDKLGGDYIIPTLAVFDDVSDIDVDTLPSSFVLKANHGSGWNIICEDKSKFDFTAAKKKLKSWLKTNYFEIGKEYQYQDIIPRIICEKYLESTPSEQLLDYKIFCFNGQPKYIQVDLDRFTNHKRNFFDLDWRLVPFTTLYPMGHGRIERPKRLDEMLFVAEILSQALVFARIDLYFHKGSIFFGEITLHHGGGFEPFMPSEYDIMLGDLLKI